uniref:BTB domain-containing protein n=1 Tax=Strongyloides papillosus TaxID=174720 RepID=A0A0N5B6Q5_STREA
MVKTKSQRMKYKFSILNDKAEEKSIKSVTEACDFVKDTLANSWGFTEFVKKDFLLDESNGLLIDDKLTILCEAEITDLKYGNHSNQKTSVNIMIPKSKILLNYGNMFESSIFTDCSINVETTEIKVHKAVLAAQSPVFYDILNSTLENSQRDVIEMTDFRVEVVKEMLRFIYTDKVSDITNMASEVLVIADKYRLDRLKAISERSLCRSLAVENVLERFALSEKFSTESLKNCCLELILENAGWITKTKEWKEFVIAHPLLVESLFIKLLNLSLTESI